MLATVAPAAPAAAVPTAPYTAFTLAGRFDAVGTPQTSAFEFDWIAPDYFHVQFGLPSGESYTAFISAPVGKTLSVGTYTTRRNPDPDHAGLDVVGNFKSCDASLGTITITEVVRHPETNAVNALALSYDLISCPVHGEIRWNSSKGYSAAVVTNRILEFGSVGVGDQSAVKIIMVRSLGSKDLAFGTGRFDGNNQYIVIDDSCSEATLSYNQTCSVSIAARPYSFGDLPESFVLPSNTAGGMEVMWMRSTGVKSNKGTYYPVTPSRILDTRVGNGAAQGALGPGTSIDLQVTGRGGVPVTGVMAVVLNVTVVEPTDSGHITVWPTGVTRPATSSLNFTAGWVGANSVTVAVGAGGKVSLFNSGGYTHLLADVVGWYADATVVDPANQGGQLFTRLFTDTERLLDTRVWGQGKLDGGETAHIFVDYGWNANFHIKALMVNVTSTESETPGFLTAWNGDGANRPQASTLNLAPGTTVSNLAVVPVRQCWECTGEFYALPMIGIYASGVSHVIVDLFAVYDDGFFASGLRLEALTPTRIVDSRTGLGTPGALTAGTAATITPPPAVANPLTKGLLLNMTAVAPTTNTFITVWPTGTAQPMVSNLNPSAGRIVPNAVFTELSLNQQFNVYNNEGTVHFLVDVVGRFYEYAYRDFGQAKDAAKLDLVEVKVLKR